MLTFRELRVGPLSPLCKENETPFHVIGSCLHNGLQITSRHHKVKHQLKQLLEHKVMSVTMKFLLLMMRELEDSVA